MTRRAIFGGSFDPIHLGHIRLARAALQQLELDEVYLIPAAHSPFKQDSRPADALHRMKMCCIACADDEKITVSDIEIAAGGISYTYLTADKLSKPDEVLYLLCGADAFAGVHTWKYEGLLKQKVIVVGASRTGNGEEAAAVRRQADFLASIGYGVEVIDFRPVEVSSSQIRSILLEGGDTENLLDPAVRRYIDENNLYKNPR